jgi:hypothetical protein
MISQDVFSDSSKRYYVSITSHVRTTRKIMDCLNQFQKERALHDDIADNSAERDAGVILIVRSMSSAFNLLGSPMRDIYIS